MKRRTIVIIVCALVLICAGWWVFAATPKRQVRRLPDGTILSLERVMAGRTNVFLHGTAIEKLLNPVLPAKGFDLWGIHLKKPQGVSERVNSPVSTLTFEFKQFDTLNRRLGGSQYRVVIAGDDGFEYVTERPYFASYSDGYFGYISTATFPRDSRTLHIAWKERLDSREPWKTIAEFTHRQSPVSPERWKAETLPVVRESRGTRVTFSDVAVLPTPYPGMDVWHRDLQVRWQVTRDGTVETNWRMDSLVISDSSGNCEAFNTTFAETNGWLTSRLWQMLNPGREWKIKTDISRTTGFAASNIFTVRVPPSQAAGVQANCAGNRVHVSFASYNTLSIELLDTNKTGVRLKFIRALDDTGKDIAERFTVEEKSRIMQLMKSPAPVSEAVVTFAIDENIPVELIVRPRQVLAR